MKNEIVEIFEDDENYMDTTEDHHLLKVKKI